MLEIVTNNKLIPDNFSNFECFKFKIIKSTLKCIWICKIKTNYEKYSEN